MHKQRLAYGNDNGFAYPSNWLFYITNASKYLRSGVYGITNLKIDGISSKSAMGKMIIISMVIYYKILISLIPYKI